MLKKSQNQEKKEEKKTIGRYIVQLDRKLYNGIIELG